MHHHDQRIVLDDLDFAILSQLREDGRKSFSDIARDLKVAVNTVRNRVGKMVEEGTLNFIGRVNPLHAGFHAYASIFVAVEPSSLIEDVAVKLTEMPETSFVCMTTGEFDLWMDVMCRDNQHLTELVTDRIQKIPGVHRTKTLFIMKVFKYSQPDLGALRDQTPEDVEALSAPAPNAKAGSDRLPYR